MPADSVSTARPRLTLCQQCLNHARPCSGGAGRGAKAQRGVGCEKGWGWCGGQERAGAGAGGRGGGGGVVLAPRRLGSIFMTVIYYLLHSAIKLDRAVLGSWWSER